jgi:Tol biopolymer transport system component
MRGRTKTESPTGSMIGALVAACALGLVLVAPAHAVFAGKPGLIVYEAPGGGGSDDIFSVPFGGTTGTNLTQTPGADDESFPVVSADGTRVVYGRNGNVWVMNVDGSGQTQLTNTTNDDYPAWSRDGTRIVFARDADIWVMNSDGSAATQLTPTDANTDYDPAFSPDGRTIVFSSGGPARLNLMNADGTNRRAIESGHAESDYYANFSADGRKVVFSSGDELYELDVATGTISPALVNDPPNRPFNPVYAPDGSSILASAGTGDNRLLSYSRSGSFVGSFAPEGTNADWQPVPVMCGGKRSTIVGTAAADVLTGTPDPDVIAGLGGKDNIKGLAGKDILCGGKGRDTLIGGAGRDRLLGAKGRDNCKGGGGRDSGKGCEQEKSL